MKRFQGFGNCENLWGSIMREKLVIEFEFDDFESTKLGFVHGKIKN